MRHGHNHNDKVLTLAISRLIQSDLQYLINLRKGGDRVAAWQTVDGGVTARHNESVWSNPKASFFIRQTDFKMPVDWVDRMSASEGGPYFKVFLRVNTLFDDSGISGVNVAKGFGRIYNKRAHVVCTMSYGEYWGSRWSTSGERVCDGVFGLLDNPDISLDMAEKLRIVMNSFLLTKSKIHPH